MSAKHLAKKDVGFTFGRGACALKHVHSKNELNCGELQSGNGFWREAIPMITQELQIWLSLTLWCCWEICNIRRVANKARELMDSECLSN